MSSIAMYNPINMPDADVFAAAAIVLITLATATLILQIESLKQINAVQDCMQEQEQEKQAATNEVEAVVEPPVAEAPVVEPPVAEAPVAEAPVADAPVAEAVSPYPTMRPEA